MNILIVNPATASAKKGNDVTSSRWKHHLEALGHTVTIASEYRPGDWDLLLALHAYKSAEAIETVASNHPSARIIVALTGTDVYRDLREEESTTESLERADDLVVLQELARREIPQPYRDKTHVVHQSVLNPPVSDKRPAPETESFQVLTVAHLRGVKDPLRLGYASRELPADSDIHAFLIGAVLEDDYEEKLREFDSSERFTYLGEKPREQTLQYIKGADVLVVPSRLEGGANVVTEAISSETPIIASDIPGNRGLLGDDYPGYFPVDDTEALRNLLVKCEKNPDFYGNLKDRITSLKPRVTPDHERAQWKDVLQS